MSKSAKRLRRYGYYSFFSRWWPSAILDFQNPEILTADRVWRARCITVPNFIILVKRLQRYGNFSFFKDAVVRHLGYLGTFLDHPLRVLGRLYHLSKFGWNPFSRLWGILPSWVCTSTGLLRVFTGISWRWGLYGASRVGRRTSVWRRSAGWCHRDARWATNAASSRRDSPAISSPGSPDRTPSGNVAQQNL